MPKSAVTLTARARRRYKARVKAGFANPLDAAGPSNLIRATHIDKHGFRYEIPAVALEMREAMRDKPKPGSGSGSRPNPPLAIVDDVPVRCYRPSARQREILCDSCKRSHLNINIHCFASPACQRRVPHIDPRLRYCDPIPAPRTTVVLRSLVPGKHPDYKAVLTDLLMHGKSLPCPSRATWR